MGMNFSTDVERLQYLADGHREAAAYRPTAVVNAEVMALVYEVVAGKPGALEALREQMHCKTGLPE